MNKITDKDSELIELLKDATELADSFPELLETLRKNEPDPDSFEEVEAFQGAAHYFLEYIFEQREEYNEMMELLGENIFNRQLPFDELVNVALLHFTMLGNAFRILTNMYEDFLNDLQQFEDSLDVGQEELVIGKKEAITVLNTLHRLKNAGKLLPEEQALEEDLTEALSESESERNWKSTRFN